MASQPSTIVRPLAAIVCDLSTTKARLSSLTARLNGIEPDADEDRLWDELDQRQYALEQEFDIAMFRTTGVSWEMLEAVRA